MLVGSLTPFYVPCAPALLICLSAKGSKASCKMSLACPCSALSSVLGLMHHHIEPKVLYDDGF